MVTNFTRTSVCTRKHWSYRYVKVLSKSLCFYLQNRYMVSFSFKVVEPRLSLNSNTADN